jgi:hypothetical protein
MFLPLTGRPSRGERDSCPVGVGAIQVRLSYDSTSMRHDRAERGTKRNQDMTTFTIDNQHSLTVLDPPQMHAPLTLIETLPPLACLHCASTQAYRAAGTRNRRRPIGLRQQLRMLRPGDRQRLPPVRQHESGVWNLRLRLRFGNRLRGRGRALPLPGLRLLPATWTTPPPPW